jgi:hypothetical protein
MASAIDKLKQLRKELKERRAAIGELESEIHKTYRFAIQESADEKVYEFIQLQKDNPAGLNRTLLRDLLCWNKRSEDIHLENTEIALHGSGPWNESELEDFFTDKDFSLVSIDYSPTILIIGEFDVDKEIIQSYISSCLGSEKNIKIYTQELFIYWLISGEDPLEALETQTLIDLVENHLGMGIVFEYESAKWPEFSNTNYENSAVTEFDTEDWGNESILHKFGYTAKHGELSVNERQSILREVFEQPLTNFLESNSDRLRWGSAKSPQRLYAISNFLYWLMNFQGSTKPLAAQKWKSDLEWLKATFYNKKMSFRWPNQYSLTDSKRPPRKEIKNPWYLKIGKRVFQEKYGWGKFMKVQSKSGTTQITIKFDSDGIERTFDMEIAKILG